MIDRLIHVLNVNLLRGLVLSRSEREWTVIFIQAEVVAWLLLQTFAWDYGVSLFAVSSEPYCGLEEIFVDNIAELTAGLDGFGHLLAGSVVKLESPL